MNVVRLVVCLASLTNRAKQILRLECFGEGNKVPAKSFRTSSLSEAPQMSVIDIENFLVLRADLHRDSRKHSELKRWAPFDGAEDAEKVRGSIAHLA